MLIQMAILRRDRARARQVQRVQKARASATRPRVDATLCDQDLAGPQALGSGGERDGLDESVLDAVDTVASS